ncbi:MAG: replication-associated recombination protein A [Acidobacteriaceae bacterium]|nr:replication-associated recombination protein A [Acidobacteriaceae bacterium]MBV9498528.1 replication-associated recombination protein A [Acidobacteriaceae bacterium]
MSLFDNSPPSSLSADDLIGRPLADRMRPRTLEEYVGQEHILGPGKPLRTQIEKGQLSSLILWGPPGSGKTTLAALTARQSRADFVPFSAVLSGIKEIKAVMADAERARRIGRKTVLFIDEIHRFNKAQQDAFLPYVERGDVVLIGATTENPSFEVISALLSRTKVYSLRPLETVEVITILKGALQLPDRGLGHLALKISDDLVDEIAASSSGDARAALNTLEIAAALAEDGVITQQAVADAMQRKVLLYDKAGEEHYNLISALHKSVRSSDVDAALYWLARMMKAGEDRLYLARRLVRMAIEDIGLADPRAVEQGIACMQTVHFLGIPEGDQALAQLTIYLALAPKSDAAYRALNSVNEVIETSAAPPVPLHLRNAPTRLMKEMGYAKGYRHAHLEKDAVTDMACLPESLAGTAFYEPTDRGFEQKISERLNWLRNRKAQIKPVPSTEK